MSHCPRCGMPLSPLQHSRKVECPKCGASSRILAGNRQGVYLCDIAHNRETVDEALDKLDRAVAYAWRSNYRGVKVIHGRGTREHSHGGSIASAARNRMQSLANYYGGITANDRATTGATLIWFEG